MLDIFSQALDLLTQKPGDLVYHLIVVFAIEAILGMAIARRGARRSGWVTPLRPIAITGAILLVGRIVLMVAALLTLTGVIVGNAITPPLERAIDLISLGFLAWAFTPLLREHKPLGLAVLMINLIAGLITYAVLASQWYRLSATPNIYYTVTSQETIWQVWSLALALFAALAILVKRDDQSGLSLVAFLIAALGHALQFFSPQVTSHVAGWVRLTQVAAYPLFAIVVFQLITNEEPRRPAEPSVPITTVFDFSDAIWQTLEAIRGLSVNSDLSLALQQITSTLAPALKANVAAIGLTSDVPNSIDLVAIHHPGASPAPGAIFVIDKQPSVKRALERRRPITLTANDTTPELNELYGLMGSFVAGPLLIVPLHDETKPLGVVLLGNPNTRREWTAADAQRARTLADYLATTLSALQHSRQLASRVGELEQSLRKIETDTAQRRSQLEAALQQAQAEAQRAKARLDSLAKLQEEQMTQRGSDEKRWQQLAGERAQLESEVHERTDEVNRLMQLQIALESQLKDAQQQITHLQDQLQKPEMIASHEVAQAALDHQREVVASVVQELRTPMTSITGYTDLLLGESVGILGAMQRQFLQRVKANVERMDGMLNDLIGITAIDTGSIKIEPEPVDVSEVIEDTVMASAALFRERELSIRIELADGLPKVRADRDSLLQIVKHLLSNAALCSPNNSEIVVRAQVPADMPDHLLFSVTDRGGGIAPEDRQRAFHRMYRADHPLLQGLGETGVGLSISKALVEAQGGRIWVDSEMGVGSTFTFILPLNGYHAEIAA